MDNQEISAEPVKPGLGARLMDACRGPRALPAFGVVSFLESSFLPIPIDVAMIPLCLARPKQLWLIVLVGTLGSIVGAVIGYLIGLFFMETLGKMIVAASGLGNDYDRFRSLYAETGWIAVLIGGITPIPFKAVAILSGAAGMRFDLFLLAAFGIRFVRFGMIVVLIRLVGPAIHRLIETNGRAFTITMASIMTLGILATPLLF